MKVKRFEDLIAWQKAIDLAVVVYSYFGSLKDYGFKDQICRAVISVSATIAEGFDRGSDADFKRFLNFARSSSNEVKSMSYLAEKLHYVSVDTKDELIERCSEVSRIIYGLYQSLDR